jgi:hypothetical protein
MAVPTLKKPQLIKLERFPVDRRFKLRLARADEDQKLFAAFEAGHLEVQMGGWTKHYATLTLVGSKTRPRSVASLSLDLRQFDEVVRYNPADPPLDYTGAKTFQKYNEKTQSDFAGAKKRNLIDYTMYGIEALRGERKANLPEINGWCDVDTSERSLFVVLHSPDPDVFYGALFLPSLDPIMQSDGQTQTAMLFELVKTNFGRGKEADFRVKLEVEFGLTPDDAGQAFADRNGRGVKKNRNLINDLTSIGGLAAIMPAAIKGTIFEHRIYRGRGRDTVNETTTKLILDLATLEQIVLNVCTHGSAKGEHMKDIHVDTFTPYVRDFLLMLEKVFASDWPAETPKGQDPYRKLYVHGWSFCFKALARAYHRTRIDELGPLADALQADSLEALDVDTEKDWKERAQKLAAEDQARPKKERRYEPPITPTSFERRLMQVDWVRHRKHWVEITSFTRDSDNGRPNTKRLADGTEVVKAKAPTQQEVIAGIEGTLLGPDWKKLTGTVDFDYKKA